MVDANIAYIKTEPMTPTIRCSYVKNPNYRCTIELIDGSTIIRCGFTEQHALANALACYRTSGRPKALEAVVTADSRVVGFPTTPTEGVAHTANAP